MNSNTTHTTETSLLFIGGAMDGEWHTVSDDENTHTLCSTPKLYGMSAEHRKPELVAAAMLGETSTLEQHVYHKWRLYKASPNAAPIYVMVFSEIHHNTTMQDIMHHLLSRYAGLPLYNNPSEGYIVRTCRKCGEKLQLKVYKDQGRTPLKGYTPLIPKFCSNCGQNTGMS